MVNAVVFHLYSREASTCDYWLVFEKVDLCSHTSTDTRETFMYVLKEMPIESENGKFYDTY
eukprot:m.408916 g.408916  ORF g.408916 m.408916 type:complete len:61 (+) comp21238_c0_seq24:846-1028(+)